MQQPVGGIHHIRATVQEELFSDDHVARQFLPLTSHPEAAAPAAGRVATAVIQRQPAAV